MEAGMKICILIHLPMVPLPTEHTPKLPGEPLRGADSFSGTLSLPMLLLSVLNITALVMHWTAVKFQLLPPTVRVDTQPIKLTYKVSYKSWLFIPSCAPVDSWLWQRGCGLGKVHLHPSTPPLVTVQAPLLVEAASAIGGLDSEGTYQGMQLHTKKDGYKLKCFWGPELINYYLQVSEWNPGQHVSTTAHCCCRTPWSISCEGHADHLTLQCS